MPCPWPRECSEHDADPALRPGGESDRPVAFISYAREDQAYAEHLAEALAAVFVDHRANWQLSRGDSYRDQLQLMIRESDAFQI
nr:TIR domain-containing protein [Aquabacterium terrae]